MMHANLSITDGIYGMFSEEEVKNRITGLNRDSSNRNFTDEEMKKLAVLIADQMRMQS